MTSPCANMLLAVPLLAAAALAADKEPDPFVDRIVSYELGKGAGHNRDEPEVVLGPPRGGGKLAPSDHVLSLGRGGTITLEFVDNEVFDGEGPDFLVFENPFLKAPGDDPNVGYFELAKVEVSADGENWKEFPHDRETRAGCAGWHPVLANADENYINPTDPEAAGGDPFDLKDVGLAVVRFIRITDLENAAGDDGAAGFDLDAVAAVHSRARTDNKEKK
ncbi:MAG: hypothetical protein ACT4QC_15480 [Planctomycetaceae bacterium]